MASAPIWLRYMPGLAAAAVGTAIIAVAPPQRRVACTVLATLFGLICMEAEYWLATGFPRSELSFFVTVVALSLAALAIGDLGAMWLGLAGLLFFAYVNLRFGAPYLLDYVMPVFYALLLVWSRRALGWTGRGIWRAGRIEALALVAEQCLVVWRTFQLTKWGWIAGKHWP